MALEGDLELFRLPDILQVIAQQRKTGILTVQGKSDILAVSFLDGEIVAADALNQSFEALLGEVLASRGAVAPARFAELADEQRHTGSRLVDLLVERRVLGRDQLLESLRDLTFRLLAEVLRWREGQFKFYGGEEVAFEEGIRPLTVDDVLMRALRESAGEPGKAGWMPHGFLAYAAVADARPMRVIPGGFDESLPLDPQVAWVTPEEKALLERLDGKTPAETLARLSGLGEAKTYYALYRLLQAGLARPVAEAESAAAPAPVESTGRRPFATPKPARAEALKIEEEAFAERDRASHLAWDRRLSRVLRIGAVLVMAALLAVAIRQPGRLLFAAPGMGSAADGYQKWLRLCRFELIDRSARTYHLLEGRYPASFEELTSRGLLPAGVRRDPAGGELLLQSGAEEYRILVNGTVDAESGQREGVFGDFLLDSSMFADLERESGVPVILVD